MYKSITIKIGSNVLTRDDGSLNIERMTHITDQIADLHKKGIKVILISSGAVAAGRSLVSWKSKKDPISERQVLSSVGQIKLVSSYSRLFDSNNISCAQVLVTKEDFRTREHYLNMKNCLSVLLDNQIIPVINENDAVSVTALMFTDNDELAGLVATMMGTEALLLLSNVDGIYNGDPEKPGAELIKIIDSPKTNLADFITTEKSCFGRGGMLTKGKIAQSTAASGVTVHIANGNTKNIISSLAKRNSNIPHTKFIADSPKPAVKKWMAYSAGFASSEVHINEGARDALYSERATSLLLAGVTEMKGSFKKGDLLKIVDHKKQIIGIGKAQYDRKRADDHLHDEKYKALIHYDYLLLYH